MASTYLFRAKKAAGGDYVKVDIWLAGVNRGFTKTNGDYLQVLLNTSGTYEWYAKKDGVKIREGKTGPGYIDIIV